MKNAPKDETCYCQQCGISFLWSIEEQTPGTPKPTCCPGCAHSQPAPGRERGLVKWYSVRKKYGFIVRTDQPDIFAHRAQLTGAGRLQEGDLVEFGVEESAKGPVAVDIRVLEREPDLR